MGLPMPKNSSLRPRRLPSLGNEALQWVINVPASLSPTGKRQRRFFATREQAEVECELLKTRKINFGHSLLMMSPERIAEARACYSRLESECPGVTLSHAVEEFITLHRRRTASVSLRSLFDTFLESKREANRNYRRELRNVFERVAALNDILVADLDPQQIEQALSGFPDGNRNAALRYLRAAFNYGIRRGWLTENPIGRLEFKKCICDSVEVIPPATVEKLLSDALANDLELVPFLVFAFFCGVRPDGELKKLLWSDLDMTAKEHHVTIRAAIAKKGRKRWIDLSENALAWLREYRNRGGKMEGRIFPLSATTLRRKRRRNALAAGLDAWPQQGARHTWCSAWLRQHGDINKLVLQAGHESPTVMWNHYYQAMTPQDAAAFWAIYPPVREERQIIPFAHHAS
jgi:integrase